MNLKQNFIRKVSLYKLIKNNCLFSKFKNDFEENPIDICSICLKEIKYDTGVNGCMHKFCYS